MPVTAEERSTIGDESPTDASIFSITPPVRFMPVKATINQITPAKVKTDAVSGKIAVTMLIKK